MARDYYYPLKKIGMATIRAAIPVALKITGEESKRPKPTASTTYTPTTGAARKPLRMNIYRPSADAKTGDAPLPVHVNVHGSGFCINSFGADAAFCAWLADAVPCVVVDVDHRKAPEHPWPAGPSDVRDAVAFVRAGAERFGWDGARVSVGGFSSGGCLALVEASRPREAHERALFAVVAFYPSTNLAEPAHLKPQLQPDKGASGAALPPWFRRFLYSCYLPAPLVRDASKTKEAPKGREALPTRADPGISPLGAPAARFPPTTLVTAGQDSLAREARALHDKLAAAGADARHWEAPGQGHDWDHQAKEGTRPAELKWEAYGLAAERLREAFGAPT